MKPLPLLYSSSAQKLSKIESKSSIDYQSLESSPDKSSLGGPYRNYPIRLFPKKSLPVINQNILLNAKRSVIHLEASTGSLERAVG